MKDAREYFKKVKQIIHNSPIFENPWKPPQIIPGPNRFEGTIRTEKELVWDAKIKFLEHFIINQLSGNVTLQKYAYEYHEDDFYFRYERDILNSLDDEGQPKYNHPEYHLHANSRSPRYLAPPIDLETFLKFVEATQTPK